MGPAVSRAWRSNTKPESRLPGERVTALLDPESFVEVGMFASGVVTGFGTVEDRPVYVYAQEYAKDFGAMDAAQADKIVRIMDLAVKTGAPVVALLDSAGADLTKGVSALDAYARIMAKTAQISGVVPQISVIAGPCAGGATAIPAMGDFVVAANTAEMFVTGPQVVSARTGKDISAKELGGAETLDANGLAHLCAASEAEAFAQVRRLIALLPANNEEDAPMLMQDDLNRQLDIDSYYDAHDLLARVADFGDYLELQKGFGKSMVAALGRLGGRSVGFLANNPAQEDGALNDQACQKAGPLRAHVRLLQHPRHLLRQHRRPGHCDRLRERQSHQGQRAADRRICGGFRAEGIRYLRTGHRFGLCGHGQPRTGRRYGAGLAQGCDRPHGCRTRLCTSCRGTPLRTVRMWKSSRPPTRRTTTASPPPRPDWWTT